MECSLELDELRGRDVFGEPATELDRHDRVTRCVRTSVGTVIAGKTLRTSIAKLDRMICSSIFDVVAFRS